MSTPPNSHKKRFPQDIDAWVLAAQEQRAKMHMQAAGPWHSNERYEAFAAMSEVLLLAFEEMRVISATLREDSQSLRSHADGLCAHSQQLLDRYRRGAEPSPRWAPPSAEAMQHAESRLLDMFKGESRPSE
jgi:hypothetical protein